MALVRCNAFVSGQNTLPTSEGFKEIALFLVIDYFTSVFFGDQSDSIYQAFKLFPGDWLEQKWDIRQSAPPVTDWWHRRPVPARVRVGVRACTQWHGSPQGDGDYLIYSTKTAHSLTYEQNMNRHLDHDKRDLWHWDDNKVRFTKGDLMYGSYKGLIGCKEMSVMKLLP